MKLLYVVTKSNWGGAQRHVYDLATYFKTQGHDVVVALGGQGALHDKLTEAGVRTVPILSLGRDMHAFKDLVSLKEIFSIVRRERPDVVHLHSPKAAGLGGLAARLFNGLQHGPNKMRIQHIIMTAHGWTWNEDRPLPQKALIALSSWLTMILSTETITLSARELAQAAMFPFVAEKLRLIPLGISKPEFLTIKAARTFFSEKIHIDLPTLNKKTIIGTISELHPNKGLVYLINAIKEVIEKFPQVIVIIMGGGDERANLEALISERGLTKHIYILGNTPNAATYLRGFNIFTLTSIKEGLPYAILEAGHAHLPVVASAVGGIPELIDDMNSGILIQAKKTKEISHAIRFLLEHKAVQKEYGKALGEKIVRDFSLKTMLDAITELYSTPAQ